MKSQVTKHSARLFPIQPVALGVFVLLLTACASASVGNSGIGPMSPLLKVRMAIDATLPPYESPSADPQVFVGFDIEVMQAIAARAGLQIEFYNVGAASLISFVQRCQVDGGISLIPITPSLAQSVQFSNPYYSAPQVIVVKKGNRVITDKSKLAGMRVGVQTSARSEQAVGEIPMAQTESYPSAFLALQDLTLGEIDAVIADQPRALSQVRIKSNNLKIVDTELGQVDYGIALCKDRGELLDRINTGLAAIQADGTLKRLKQKWIVETNP